MSTVGNRAADQPVAFVVDQRQGDDDQTVENGATWKFQQLRTSLRRRLDIVQHDRAAVRSQPRHDAAQPLKGRLLVEERHEHSDQRTAFTPISC